MDEDISIINTNTRNEKIKNFFVSNKKRIIVFASLIFLVLLVYFVFEEYKSNQKVKISNFERNERGIANLIQFINKGLLIAHKTKLLNRFIGVKYA